ncbi:MAG TPA: hypothetical protein VG474_07175 [Solirubrobacteraceae bacterium]|nr:hypothetical protein [Solirubrobacteraceae bacterium]
MADHLILRSLSESPEAERILDEFEQRTGLQPETRDGARVYALHEEDHRTRIVQTLTEIDPAWTDHLGLQMPA